MSVTGDIWKILAIVAAFASICGGASAGEAPKPGWASSLSVQESGGYRYFVGVASGASTREEAMEKSWLNWGL
jgi:hypothetical protein